MLHRRTHSMIVLLAGTAMLVLAGCEQIVPLLEESTQGTSDAQSIQTDVLRVIDGDTLAVSPVEDALPASNEQGDETIIRLLGIDTPELHTNSSAPAECGAEEAAQSLRQHAPEGTAVTIQLDPLADAHDRYGRTLGYVMLSDGTDLAEQQVADGWASAWYPRGEPEPERFDHYRSTERDAISARRGAHEDCETVGR